MFWSDSQWKSTFGNNWQTSSHIIIYWSHLVLNMILIIIWHNKIKIKTKTKIFSVLIFPTLQKNAFHHQFTNLFCASLLLMLRTSGRHFFLVTIRNIQQYTRTTLSCEFTKNKILILNYSKPQITNSNTCIIISFCCCWKVPVIQRKKK